jgi:hypothetical protein
MSLGVDAVKSEISIEFGSTVVEHFDVDSMSTDLGFVAEGRNFAVRVSKEFDDDYPSGQLNIDLKLLGSILRASKNGKATVRTTGIS